MFEGFARVWTPVMMAEDLPRAAPIASEVAGTKVVLFRDGEGKPAALVDRCPHRGVALSLGKVKGGCIECPFHGWQLDGEGNVCHVPWNPDAKKAALSGIAIPTREVAGQIWIYTSAGASPAEGPAVHEAFLRSDVRISGIAIDWATHWTRAMENMLDWPHLPFVHSATIGKQLRGRSDRRMDIHWEERPWGVSSRSTIDGVPQEGSLDFRWPNMMNLFIPIPKRTMIMQAACVPIDATRTRMLLVTLRDFMKPRLFDAFFHRSNRRIAAEDKAIVESSFPAEVPPAGEEWSVRTDGLTLMFRKRYFAELRGSSCDIAGPPARRPVALPLAS